MILLDTNSLARLANKTDPEYQLTRSAIAGCWEKNRKLCLADQTLQEFWVVATRTQQKNGLGMAPIKANAYVSHFSRRFLRLSDPPELFETWRTLVNSYAITGIRAYDARFAAFVHAHRLRGFMTFNLQDFATFSLNLINPREPSTW